MRVMNIWLVKVGEPLPTDGQESRLGRTGLLAAALAKAGHRVTWWTSRFAHARKRYRHELQDIVPVRENYEIRPLRTVPYRRNIGLGRIASEWLVARQFQSTVESCAPPDLIFCSLPTPKLCRVAAEYGLRRGVPVVVDIRDLWPEAQAQLAPPSLRPAARLILRHEFSHLRFACRHAAALSGITDEFVDWGLRHGGRARSALDFAFSLSPPPDDVTEQQKASAATYWDSLGLYADPASLTICFLGVLGRRSAAEMNCLIDAVGGLQSAGVRVRLVLAGAGDMQRQFAERARGLENILFPGWIEYPEVVELMRRSDAGIIPYDNSFDFQMALPNKALQYLASGLPILSSIDGVLSRLIEQSGCGETYCGTDERGLQDLLVRWSRKPESLGRMRHQALDLFQKQFDPKRVYGTAVRRLETIAETARSWHSDHEPILQAHP